MLHFVLHFIFPPSDDFKFHAISLIFNGLKITPFTVNIFLIRHFPSFLAHLIFSPYLCIANRKWDARHEIPFPPSLPFQRTGFRYSLTNQKLYPYDSLHCEVHEEAGH